MRRRKQRLSSNAGYTFIELLVAVSLLALVALAAAGVANMMTHANDYADRKNEQQALASLILNNVSHAASCSKAIGPNSGLNQTVDPVVIQQQSAAGGWPVKMMLPGIVGSIQDGTILPLRKLKIRSLRFADAEKIVTGPPTTTYLGSLILGTDEISGRSQKDIHVATLTITTDAAGVIQKCQSLSDQSYQQTCQDMGWRWVSVWNVRRRPGLYSPI